MAEKRVSSGGGVEQRASSGGGVSSGFTVPVLHAKQNETQRQEALSQLILLSNSLGIDIPQGASIEAV